MSIPISEHVSLYGWGPGEEDPFFLPLNSNDADADWDGMQMGQCEQRGPTSI